METMQAVVSSKFININDVVNEFLRMIAENNNRLSSILASEPVSRDRTDLINEINRRNWSLTKRIIYYRKLHAALLTNRNANWAAWISQQLQKPGTTFMAVGAGHLAGSTSVQHLLSAYGIQATRISY